MAKQNKPKTAEPAPKALKPAVVDPRQLKDLISVARATLKDFEVLGIKTVSELAQQEAKGLYKKLCKLSAERHDACTEDVFTAAIAQAKNPKLSAEKCDWWYWNRRRKRAPKTPV